MPDCIGCHLTKPVAHFAPRDTICRVCRGILDDARDKPPRAKLKLCPVRHWHDGLMPMKDQMQLLTDCVKAVAARHGQTPDAILGRSHKPDVTLARIDLYRRLYAVLQTSRGVAKLVGRDHSTIHRYCVVHPEVRLCPI